MRIRSRMLVSLPGPLSLHASASTSRASGGISSHYIHSVSMLTFSSKSICSSRANSSSTAHRRVDKDALKLVPVEGPATCSGLDEAGTKGPCVWCQISFTPQLYSSTYRCRRRIDVFKKGKEQVLKIRAYRRCDVQARRRAAMSVGSVVRGTRRR